MSQKTLFTKSLLAVAVAIVSSQAWSAGFQLNEFSSSGLGRAYSGEGAIADNAGSASRNPAAIMMFDRPSFSGGAIFVDPDVNVSGRSPSGRTLDADNIAPTAWAGIMYELDENNRYSLTYRSEVKVDFEGDYRSELSSSPAINAALSSQGLPYGTGGSTIGGNLTLNLPEMWELSGYNKVAPQWAIHYSLAYTSWSQFEELKATSNNGQTLFYKDESFRDSYRLALGTTYFMDDNWTLRAGIAFDDSPVPSDHRSISIPDQDRLWLSTGATYAFNKDASVDVGVSYMHGQHVEFTEGPYTFKSEGKAWLYGTNFNYAF